MSHYKESYYNIRVKKIRRINERLICDLVNGDGTLILSGPIDWVQRLAHERNYEIENSDEANAQLDAMTRDWGVY